MIRFFQITYNYCPIWLQNLLISIYGFILKKRRYGKRYSYYLNLLKKSTFISIDDLKRYQNKEFINLLNYTVRNSNFYKDLYKGIDIDKIKSIDDISKLPIVTKEMLRKNVDYVYTVTKKGNVTAQTGGTTGKPLTVIYRREDVFKRNAQLDYFKLQHGFVNLKMKTARFNGRNFIPLNQKKKIFWRDNYSLNLRYYSSFFLNQENLPYYIRNLNQFKPQAIEGAITSIYELAKYMIEHKISPSFKPVAIFPTSETVLPIHRKVIEEVFGCPLRDQYASNEGAPFIAECTEGYMHELLTTGVFEHVKTETGIKLLLTSFTTYGTPLIRYDIGDYVIEADDDFKQKCNCLHTLIKGIDGRRSEFLTSINGNIISLTSLSVIVQSFPNCIKNTQFIQDKLETIHIKIVVDEKMYKEEFAKEIIKEMQYRFGVNMNFIVEKVDHIPREKSGKYSMIINKLNS